MVVKLVHIADLHAGKTNARLLNRNEDLLHSLEQVYTFLKEEKVDFLLIAGDIFDKKRPDPESQQLITEFLVKVSQIPTKVILIGGNHDSASYLSSFIPWANHFGIKIYSAFRKEDFVYPLPEKGIAFVLVPFLSERAITHLEEDSDKAKIQYAEKIKKVLHYGAQKVKDFPLKVLMAHLYFEGVKIGNTEKEVTVSQAYAIPQNYIPDIFDYVALGHVHRWQKLEQAPTETYYTGSLYQLDFGESGQDKYFNYIRLNPDSYQKVEVEKIKLSLKRKLLKLLWTKEQNETFLSQYKKPDTYVWVEIEVDTPAEFHLKKHTVERIFGDNLLKVTMRLKNQQRDFFNTPTKNSSKLNIYDPVEVYKEYRKRRGKPTNEEILKLLRELMPSS
ncbi:MAG: exonuclease subunit SbcD [Aquificota bacterium]